MESTAEKEKLKVKFVAPCQFHSLVNSTKDEVACIIYQRMIPIGGCGPDCQGYRPVRGNS